MTKRNVESTVCVTVEPSATSGSDGLVEVYFDDILEYLPKPTYTASEFEVDRGEFLNEPFLEGIWFDGGRELPFSSRIYFLAYRQSFANIPAFGIWADREESDDELLDRLGSQWGGGEPD